MNAPSLFDSRTVGQGAGTDAWSRDRIVSLIDARYTRRLPTVVTTNLGSRDLRDVFGAAVVSRLAEMTVQAKLTATDYRTERPRSVA